MGCISSKVVSKSISFQEEMNQSLQRTANGISSIGSDHFLALVCTANPVANELLSGTSNPAFPKKPAVELVRNETSSTWELTARLEQIQSTSPLFSGATEPTGANQAKRSKSCHWFPEHEISFLAAETFDRSNRGTRRARSFHTVEEFDAMVERICLSSVELTGFDGKKDSSLQVHHWEDEPQVEENNVTEAKCIISSSRLETTVPMPSLNRSRITEAANVEDTDEKRNNCENGFRRKAIANRLESLEIPATIEFPRVASLREWTEVGGHVYSPGTYVTPKFGSYTSPIPVSEAENKCIESTIFDPELVAAINECMEQLEEEEERILKQIEENFKEESAEKQDQEGIPSRQKTNDK